MIDLKEPVQLTDGDFSIVQDIVSSLEPVKLPVKALCRCSMTLITTETALNFYIVQLSKKSSELAKTLAFKDFETFNLDEKPKWRAACTHCSEKITESRNTTTGFNKCVLQ